MCLYSEIPFRKNSQHVETSEMICCAKFYSFFYETLLGGGSWVTLNIRLCHALLQNHSLDSIYICDVNFRVKNFSQLAFFKNLLISHFTQWALTCNDFFQPELETTSLSCFSAANLQENTYAEVRSNVIETTLQHGCFPEGLLHIFRALFNRSTTEGLLLQNRFKPGLRCNINF